MNAELIRMRKIKQMNVQTERSTRIDLDSLVGKIYNLNTNMTFLYNIDKNPNAQIGDYIKKIIDNIYVILEIFNEMGIYPDYFYDIYFKVNEEYRTLASQGRISGRERIYNFPEFRAKISYLMEKGLATGNYKLNPTNVRNISDYYNEMVDFLQKFHLPNEVMTLDMCREMFGDIYNDVSSCINYELGNSAYISDDIECLTRLLFNYIQFFGAIGINPKMYLDERIEKQDELGKSK